MRLFLDNHILLWGLEDVSRLTSAERDALGSGDNTVYFSPVNVWEVAIKVGLEKLRVASDFLDRVRTGERLKLLPVKLEHAWAVRSPRLSTGIRSIGCWSVK